MVAERYPSCAAAILAGSVVSRRATDTSDLDLVLIGGVPGAPFRESAFAHRWPVEVFAHTEESLRRYFADDVRRRQPSLPRMCAKGVVLHDRDGSGQRAVAEGRRLLASGPPALEPAERARLRYVLTDALDDLTGSRVEAETVLIAVEVARLSAELLLLGAGRWLGRGKWLHRELEAMDPDLAADLHRALGLAIGAEHIDELVQLGEAALTAAGGPLFEGYRVEG